VSATTDQTVEGGASISISRRSSRMTRTSLAVMLVLAFLTVRHFA
jgi:hypothetical protein